MNTHAIGILGHMAGGADAYASAPAWTAPVRQAVDTDLRGERIRLVKVFSISLAAAGLLWGVGQGMVALGEGDSERTRFLVSVLQSAILAAGGVSGFYRSRLGQLRRATYSNVAALMLSATINLAFIRNAEGAAVVAYAAAVGLAALVIQGREWLWWGGILVVSTLVGSVLHYLPWLPQFEIPFAMAATGMIFASTVGLAVPTGLFWLFNRDLTASHHRAWVLAREAADAHRLASQRAAELEQRTDQLQAKNAELNDFLYVVSHDLRAPLINLEGFSRALQDSVASLDDVLAPSRPPRWPDVKADIDESLGFIVRGVGKMDFLVQGLLELSRIDSRPNHAQPVDLGPLVTAIVDSLRFSIGERGISVQVDQLPVVVGDPMRISRVFSNLIDNAVKYMKPTGPATLHIGCVQRGGVREYFVRDNGVGIRPEDQAKIFRLFGRVGGHAVPGDGMGLTAVKKILEKHGGRVWVESALGHGSTFWFTLPGRESATAQEADGGGPSETDQDSAG